MVSCAMAYDYEALYRDTPNALGDPARAVQDVFAAHGGGPLRVLDVGCGQGRDALFVARQGHSVVGVDLAPSGIRDLTAAAAREGLAVAGVVADLVGYVPDGLFDVIVIDRTLHMLAETDQERVLARLLNHACPEGRVLISDEKSNIPRFRQVLDRHPADWTPFVDRRGDLYVKRD